jgi:hypothetical protein
MEKSDKVVIKPHHEVYIVEKVDDGFIWVNGRPYMRGQLDYAECDDVDFEVMRMLAHYGGRTINGK